jgi:glycosyltransferase involved in cell wall biosynthesis
MACGTPTIAFRHGSVPEVIEDGVSGVVVDSVEEAVHAVDRVQSMSRAACRDAFEKRFTARRMANDYVKLYERLIEKSMPLRVTKINVPSEIEEKSLLEGAA